MGIFILGIVTGAFIASFCTWILTSDCWEKYCIDAGVAEWVFTSAYGQKEFRLKTSKLSEQAQHTLNQKGY